MSNIVRTCRMAAAGLVVWLALPGAGPASAQDFTKTSAVPAARIPASEASEILVLATPHLATYGDEFDPRVLEPLLDLLADFDPDLVALESIAPNVVRDMANSEEVYGEVSEQFSGRSIKLGKEAQRALGISWSEARRRLEATLDTLANFSGSADSLAKLRRRVIPLCLATYDLYSAVLQWSYLPESDRTPGGDLSEPMVQSLSGRLDSPNESSSIGLALASRLGHQRVFPIDDHRDKEGFLQIAEPLNAELAGSPLLQQQPWKPFYDSLQAVQEQAYEHGDLLPYYRLINARETVGRDIASQWQLFYEARIASGLGRARVAYWEVRNMNIASNIRNAQALYPGSRMLVIIGAGHKGFLDAYLNELMDVRVVQLADQ